MSNVAEQVRLSFWAYAYARRCPACGQGWWLHTRLVKNGEVWECRHCRTAVPGQALPLVYQSADKAPG